MNVLIIGSGGREHALAWKVAQDPRVAKVFVAPGNAGTATEAKCENVAIDVLALEQLADFAAKNVQLTIVGPEAPLVAGVVDLFRERGLDIFGPTAGAAQLEGSKAFTKDFLARHRIPTAAYRNFTEVEPALAYLREQGAPIVIKADGLAAGKGVIVAMNLDEAEAAVRDMLAGNAFGDAGSRVVIEEFLDGEEASFIVMVDGQNVLPMATSQDHKRVGDGDSGPNTGGMGAYSPAPVVTAEVHQRVLDEVIYPTVRGMAEEGNVYTGFLYAGLMIDKSGAPKVIEFNCRFGDPETQPIMVRLESSLVLLVEAALAKALDKVEATWDPRPTVGVVLAAGAHERPLVYGNNDLPGNMLAGAVSTYVRRYGVAPGKKLVLATNNDYAYRVALDWQEAGLQVVAIADARANPRGEWVEEARQRGMRVITGSSVIEARGGKRVSGAKVARIDLQAMRASGGEWLDCDLIASSGGYSPVVHLASHLGGKPEWREEILAFVPGEGLQKRICAGAVNGVFGLAEVLADGYQAGSRAVLDAGYKTAAGSLPKVQPRREEASVALFQVPHEKPTARAPKQFVDPQNDVTAAAIELACREGFESIEHVKRYTALGFGTDQGKLGNINGLAIAARAQGKSIADTGTTMFRPNYTPVTFGAVAGRHCGHLFEPVRFTALHAWHVKNGAEFEDVGQWKRPWYFPRRGEDMHAAVARECRAVREAVGLLDASTLGKIDIQGPDAREFLNRVYTNAWTKLDVGKARYGLMCKEDGMVFDDGVTACLADNHFVMTTTTGGAARVLEWLELYHQTEWPELKVYFTSVTDHYATLTLSGPNSRKLLAEVTDIDLDKDAFPFMTWKEGKVAGVPARVFRISFTGELSYEVNVQADYAMGVLEALAEHGAKYGLTPYGTETMHVLRAEKGFIIVGQDTDASVTPDDLNMGWAVGRSKPFSWIGWRGMNRADCLREDRKQLVGLRPSNPQEVLPEGAQLVFDTQQAIPMKMVGHVTSSYMSASLGHGFALAVVKGGLKRMGQKVYAPLADGRFIEAEICSSVFYDPKGERQNVD
ncbi:phosphoribosylamine--glycine ligase [Pseudomonas aeruginosa]|uniref:phosphoribosylamine--glycine ligase n=9 Tax=Pseudomonas aeruginosa TaxID=287 RepID=UPI0006286AAE|nr:phosphoribosylamine--glycine ligase [Pseudomonas aeruginosa]